MRFTCYESDREVKTAICRDGEVTTYGMLVEILNAKEDPVNEQRKKEVRHQTERLRQRLSPSPVEHESRDPEGPHVNQCMRRATAQEMILQRVETAVREAEGLLALLDALPAKLPGAADEALWNIFLGAKR